MDPIAASLQFVTTYGPLALGWPIAYMLWQRLNKSIEAQITMGQSLITTNSQLARNLRALKESIDEVLKREG